MSNMKYPKDGWVDEYVMDLKNERTKCEFCNNEDIRFVHVLSHKEKNLRIHVGCVCAGKLTGNPELSRKMENERRTLTRKYNELMETQQMENNNIEVKKEDMAMKEENAKKAFFDSFKDCPEQSGNGYEFFMGGVPGVVKCVVRRGRYFDWGYTLLAPDSDYDYNNCKWTWGDAKGHRIHTFEDAKITVWEVVKTKLGFGNEPLVPDLRDKNNHNIDRSYIGMLKRYRKENGLSQEALARILGVSSSCVSGWETGKYTPEPSSIERIHEVCKRRVEKSTGHYCEASNRVDPEKFRNLASVIPELNIDPEDAFISAYIYPLLQDREKHEHLQNFGLNVDKAKIIVSRLSKIMNGVSGV